MKIRSLKTHPARVLVVALVVAACALATPAVPSNGSASAQEGEAGVWVLDLANEECCYCSIDWYNFYRDPNDCWPHANMQIPIGDLTGTLQLNLDDGTVSGSLSGSAREDVLVNDLDFEHNYISIEARIVNGRVEASEPTLRGGLRYWGMDAELVADISMTASKRCADEQQPVESEMYWYWIEDSRSTQVAQHAIFLTHYEAGDRFEFTVSFGVGGDVVLHWDCSCELPAGFPRPPSSEPGAAELEVSVSVASETTEEGTVVFTAQVTGADPSDLTYSWDIDGFYMATTDAPTWSWSKAEAGSHAISVEVSDGERKARAKETFQVGEKRPADRDGDGLPDDKDACPDEYAKTEDGCPLPISDRDGDGLPDDEDACPDEYAETWDGCPVPISDRDGDGLPDNEDACPDEYAETWDGCPVPISDRDGDGLPDDEDACPDEYAETWDGCPVPISDRDGDGLADDEDACPDEYAETWDGCPLPISDRDGDGLPDNEDACPDEYAETWDGCPKEAVPPTVSDLVRDLEKFLAGMGAKSPSAGQAAAGAAAVSTLLGVWVLINVVSGVSEEDLRRAVQEWRRRAAVPEVKRVSEGEEVTPAEVRKVTPEEVEQVTPTEAKKAPPQIPEETKTKPPEAEEKKLKKPGLIFDDSATRASRIKGGRAVIENTVTLLKNQAMKKVSELEDIVTLRKQFDSSGNFILKSADDLENARKRLVSQIERGRKLTVGSMIKKVGKVAGYALEVFDGIDHVMKVGAKRGYEGYFDYGCAVVAETGHKVLHVIATKNPVVGLLDGVVSVINPEWNVESGMRALENKWHDMTKEIANTWYDDDAKIRRELREEFQRHKDRIMSRTDLSDAEKVERLRRLRTAMTRGKITVPKKPGA
ncbi:MAG: thrombospondin type 3 repeat-containing protein [Anaerolineales bacterium]|nr:thrombospondin type 3 repeat-containing protein [Anaerolineales bacterium]